MAFKSLNFSVGLFGFISGFLLLITGNTLNFWLAKELATIQVIGLFSLVSLPYALNFLWAPLLDKIEIKFPRISSSSRFNLLCLLHFFGAFFVLLLSFANPITSPLKTAILSLVIAFFTSSQDIVLNAYRTELTPHAFKAKTSGIYVFGYRLGMIFSGPFAIYISEYISFQSIYLIFFGIYISFPAILFFLNLDKGYKEQEKQQEKKDSILDAFNSIATPGTIILILVFLILYRVGDNFVSNMLNPFLLAKGFNEAEIALGGKLCGIFGAAFGGIISAKFVDNKNLFKFLFWFGIIHSVAHLSYLFIGFYEKNIFILICATLIDSITGGMTMSVYIGLITCLCTGKYRATQYSILSAMMGFSRAIIPSISGYIVLYSNWNLFFVISVIVIIPALLLLERLKNLLPDVK